MTAKAPPDPFEIPALAGLAEHELKVLIALAARLDPAVFSDFSGFDLTRIIDLLRGRELVHGSPPTVVAAVARALGRFPAGLAPPSNTPLDDAQIAAALRITGADERRVLDRLAWGPPLGTVSHAQRTITWHEAASPIDRLLALNLLRPVDDSTVILPREVSLTLRGGRLFDRNSGRPPLPRFFTAKETAAPESGVSAPLPRQAVSSWRSVVDEASRDDIWVELAYAEEDGTLTTAVVRVLLVAHGSVYLVRRAGPRVSIPMNRIISAQLLEPVTINDPVLDLDG